MSSKKRSVQQAEKVKAAAVAAVEVRGINSTDLVHTLPLSEVYVSWAWNSRFAPDEGNPVTEEGAYVDTLISIAKDGQRNPCVVRPNPFYKKAGHEGGKFPYMLVEGYQRSKACAQIASGQSDVMLGQAGLDQKEVNALHSDTPTIRAFVVPMSEGQARKRNLGENMLRSQLSAPDIAFGVAKLAEAEPNASNAQLGVMIGKSEPYVAKLRRIYSTFNGVQIPSNQLFEGSPQVSLLHSWRAAPVKAFYEQMLAIADEDVKVGLSPEAKCDRYLMAIGVKKDPNAKPRKQLGQGAWKVNAPIAARELGVQLGLLDAAGAIQVYPFSAEQWSLLVPQKWAGREADDEVSEAVASACNEGVEEGREMWTSEEEGEEEREEGREVEKQLALPVEKKKVSANNNGKAAHPV